MNVVSRTTSDNTNCPSCAEALPGPYICHHEKGYLELTNHVTYKEKEKRGNAINMQVMYTDVRCTRTFYHVSKCSLPPLTALTEVLRTEKE
jgi:hypothetical protein